MLNRYFHSAPASTLELALTSSQHQCDHQHQHRKNRLWPHGGGGGPFPPVDNDQSWLDSATSVDGRPHITSWGENHITRTLTSPRISFKKTSLKQTQKQSLPRLKHTIQNLPNANMNHHTLFRCPYPTHTHVGLNLKTEIV